MTPGISSAPIAEARRLVKHFEDPRGERFRAIDGVGFAVPAPQSGRPGALVALIGPDGAGKTTLLRLLAGLLRPDGGSVAVLGGTPDPDDGAFTRRIGFMPQKFGLYEQLSVRENFELFAALRGAAPDAAAARFAELMTLTGLAGFETRLAGRLSGGMKQKLGLACALAARPDLLLLDEPTVGVDPLSRRELFRIIDAMREAGVATIFSTAYLDEAARADRVLVLDQGRLLADDAPSRWSASAAPRAYRRVPAAAPDDSAARAARDDEILFNVRAVRRDAPWLDAVPRGEGVDLLLAEDAAPPDDPALRPRAPTLEDAYAAATLARMHASPADQPDAPRRDPPALLSEEAVVVADHISRRFGSFVAVADTAFEVRRGEIFGLLGPNGAGKTTTFRMLCGLLAPTSGRVTVAGADLRTAKASARARVGYVAQKFSLYERLTVRENLRYFGEAYGLRGASLRSRIDELLAGALGPCADWPTALLPLGAKRELAMAAALVHRPLVLFADEATSGADLAARRAFWRRIRLLADAGTTVVVTTHFMEEAEYCDRILIQDAGRVLALGAPAGIRRSAGAATVEEAFIRIVQRSRSCSPR